MSYTQPKCLVPGCQRTFVARGICKLHYGEISKMVRNGKYTWKELVKRGKVLNSNRGDGKLAKLRHWLDN